MRRCAAVLAGVMMLTGPAWAGSGGADILNTLDQYMIAHAVAARCNHADGPGAATFQHKYLLVTARAAAALKLLASDLAQPNIEKLIRNHYDEIDRRVAAVIAQESCEGSHVQQALQKYDTVANSDDTELAAGNAN